MVHTQQAADIVGFNYKVLALVFLVDKKTLWKLLAPLRNEIGARHIRGNTE